MLPRVIQKATATFKSHQYCEIILGFAIFSFLVTFDEY